MIQSWLHHAELASAPLPNGKRLFQAYAALLNFVWQNDWTGACHDSSAALYMILNEMTRQCESPSRLLLASRMEVPE